MTVLFRVLLLALPCIVERNDSRVVVGCGAVETPMRRAELGGALGRPQWRHVEPGLISVDPIVRAVTTNAPNHQCPADTAESLFCWLTATTSSGAARSGSPRRPPPATRPAVR
ncbi:hypothetical protein GCM10010185_22620 [Saccharothrix coeruleofusca]|uniref:Uncharacterized protein n=1 Tax=Saccharothrix coeruleofusca TaxID=33919 RepID=A0A918ANG4_9PSEU|nr:hypothetical protein GCM10010185_22620 [Saccharothrix coeruleofusca]